MTATGQGRMICLGAFAGAHGVKGDVKVRTFTEREEDIAAYGPLATEDGRRFTLKIVRVLGDGFALVRAAEIADRDGAQALSGKRLHVARSALPALADADEYYLEDLVGLSAFTEDGAPAGVVAGVSNFGAGDILELTTAGGPVMIPFSLAAVPEIALAEGRLVVASAFLAPPEEPSGK